MARHRQPEQDAQQTETKLFLMFLFEIHVIVDVKKSFKCFTGFGYKIKQVKQAKQRLGVVVDVIVVVDVKYFCLEE